MTPAQETAHTSAMALIEVLVGAAVVNLGVIPNVQKIPPADLQHYGIEARAAVNKLAGLTS